MGIGLNNISTVTVTTAGTRVRNTATSNYATAVYVEALKTNTGVIYVGGSSVGSASYATALAPGQGWGVSVDGKGRPSSTTGGSEIQLSSIYFDSSVSGEKVQVTYFTRVDSF